MLHLFSKFLLPIGSILQRKLSFNVLARKYKLIYVCLTNTLYTPRGNIFNAGCKTFWNLILLVLPYQMICMTSWGFDIVCALWCPLFKCLGFWQIPCFEDGNTRKTIQWNTTCSWQYFRHPSIQLWSMYVLLCATIPAKVPHENAYRWETIQVWPM